jgi:putative ABC transport system permease protein
VGRFSWKNLKVVTGRLPNGATERAVVLGKTAAEVLEKKVGDTLQLETEELAVVGIVDGGAVVENGSSSCLCRVPGDHRQPGQDQHH